MLLKKILIQLFFVVLPLSVVAQTPTLDFVRQFGSTGRDEVNDMTTDGDGNIYLTGRYNGTVDFDPGSGVSTLIATGQADMFVVKLDANGNLIWARSMGSSAHTDAGKSVAVDADGNVYATASINGSFDADPGPSTFILNTSVIDDVGIIKLDASGNFVWAVRAGGIERDVPADLAIDADGNLYVTGGFESPNMDFDPGAGTFLMSATALNDIFLLKLSSSGTFIWAKKASGNGSEYAYDVAIDTDGNVVATGDFQVTVDFDPNDGVFTMAPGGGADNVFVWKLNANGELVWARQMGGPADDSAHGMSLDADDNIYVTGLFQGTADFDPGSGTFNLVSAGDRDVFVTKLAADGSHVWSKSFGGTSGDYSQWIGLDESNNVYLSGYFFGTTDLDPGNGVYPFTSAGGSDAWVSKLDPNGNLLMAYTTGGAAADVNLACELVNSEVIAATNFESVVDFNPGSASNNLTSAGATDIALQKILEVPVSGPTITNFTPNSGMVGATVTINGNNFSSIAGNNIVNFNGTAAAVSFSSLSSITVTVPAGATTGPISVTVGGITIVTTATFTVIPTPVITFTTQPDNAAVCPGEELTLTSAATGTTSLTYQWQKFDTNTTSFVDLTEGSGYYDVNTSSLYLSLSEGATPGDYRVRVNGTSAAEAYSEVATVSTLTPPDAPAANAVAIDGSCGPVAVTLTASATGTGTFRWYNNQNLNFFTEEESAGTFTTAPIAGASTVHVSFFDGTCESEKTAISISVNYDGPGSRDESFDTPANGDGNISFIETIEKQSDGKLLVSNFELGGVEYKLVRLLADGTVDPGFTTWADDAFVGNANPIGILPDEKIILGGSFTNIDGNALGRIARFNTDGSLDLAFNSGSGFNGTVREVVIQPDGKILVSGNFTAYNGTTVSRLARLNSDGTIDTSFTPGTGPSTSPTVIVLQPDNKILIAGDFVSYNGTPIARLARLNSDGTLDASLTPPTGIAPFEVALQSDGKILIGGNFETVGGVDRKNIVRLNSNGSVDLTFDPGAGADDWIYAIHEDPSGKILVGGWFQTFNNTPRNFVARLYPDGTLDPFFDAGVGPYSLVTELFSHDDQSVYIGGYISYWNDQLLNGIARVNNACIREPIAEGVTTCSSTATLTACGGANGQYRWYTTSSGGSAIAGETSSTLDISNITTDVIYYVSLADNICESGRVPIHVTFNNSAVPPPVTSGATSCAGESVQLSASGSSNGNYRWYTLSNGGTPIAGAVDAEYTTPSLAETTIYYVTIVSGECESSRVPVQATINAIPSVPSVENIATCADVAFVINATGFANGEYRWYDSEEVIISGQTSSNLNISGVNAETVYYVSGVTNNCESPRTQVSITITDCDSENEAPTISSGDLTTQVGGLISITLSTIISDPNGNLDNNSFAVILQPASGAVATIANGTLSIDYSGTGFSGIDVLTIRACDLEGSCTDAELTIEVIGDIVIYNAVSPNGDGLNDFLRLQYIEALEETKENNVVIYNRWGDIVFEIENYDNSSRVFQGFSKNGNKLPSGTYFYVVRFVSGRKEKSGYLSLRY